MQTPRRSPFALPLSFAALLTASLAGVSSLAVATAGAQCLPAACGATHVFVGFEGVTPGSPVEGLGAVHPLLNIASVPWPFGPTCAGGAFGIEENLAPNAYGTGGSTANGCLTGVRGFGDSTACVLDYDFTFAAGVQVSCFSIRMLDYGDLFPFGTAGHQVTLTGYDASNVIVDQDPLITTGPVDLVNGDACTAGPNGSGNHLFTVTGPGIVKVTLRFDASPDPNVGFDDISFCALIEPTRTDAPSWGRLKTMYR